MGIAAKSRRHCAPTGWVGLAIVLAGTIAHAAPPQKAVDTSKLPPASGQKVDFASQVQPLFAQRCYACHGGAKHEGGLRLDIRAKAMAGGDSGPAILTAKSAQSRIIHYVAGLDEDVVMPPEGEGERLTTAQVSLLRAWIDQGAHWPDELAGEKAKPAHWAYQPPKRPQLPLVKRAAWPRNEIDRFVLARLEQEGLAPSGEADRYTLIRRASIDLIGLPPTVAEVDAFVADTRPDAYERMIERLLASPHYGERWARPWLDMARYADTNGYEKDQVRSMWPYRDWVIQALNRNLPFDKFTIEQLAGDLLPKATLDQLVATGFHRNTMLNDEGGIDPEEFRRVAVIDRVNTTATVWLGSTLACAQCHSHKYDPFTQREYYQMFAFFNQSDENGRDFGPQAKVPTAKQQTEKISLDRDIAAVEAELDSATRTQQPQRGNWERERLAQLGADRPVDSLVVYYPLDEVDSGKVVDLAVAGRHGSLPVQSDARVIAASYSGGLELDGDDFVMCEQSPRFERHRAFSYGAWVAVGDGSGAILAKMDDMHGFRGFDVLSRDGTIEVHIISKFPDDALKVSAQKPIAKGQWHHVMVTYDGSSRAAGVTIYIDGQPQAVKVENDNLHNTIDTDVPLRIGRRHTLYPYRGAVDEVRVYNRLLSPGEVRRVKDEPLRAALSEPQQKRNAAARQVVDSAFRQADPQLKQLADRVAGLRKRVQELEKNYPTTLVMRELASGRGTHILVRGDLFSRGEQVSPGVPSFLPRMTPDQTKTRLGLARWLVDGRNPLTARVAVNRYWDSFFGRGLVTTLEDFGTQGEKPSHPELLDWLACRFVDSGWDIKALHRLIVTSATYRQTSRVSADLLARDRFNVLYGRGPRHRVDAEIVRDLALAASGRLVREIGGPSVFPPQPAGIWANSFAVHDLNAEWSDSRGPDRYRRGLYTYLRRTAPYPSFLIFDAPRGEVCTVGRTRTNTPLQALVTLNDPVLVEAAGGLAQRALKEADDKIDDRATLIFRLCASRQPRADELRWLCDLYERALGRFRLDEGAGKALLKQAALAAQDAETAELAAWTIVSSAVLNLDETITKG